MCISSAAARLRSGLEDNAPATSSNRSSIRAAMRCTAPMNAPGPPPTIPSRSLRFVPSPVLAFAVISLFPFQTSVASRKYFELQRRLSLLCGLCVHHELCVKSFSSRALLQSQHPPVRPLIRSRTREVIKRTARRLNNMPLDERRPLRRSLFAALDAALPLQHRPSRKVILHQL